MSGAAVEPDERRGQLPYSAVRVKRKNIFFVRISKNNKKSFVPKKITNLKEIIPFGNLIFFGTENISTLRKINLTQVVKDGTLY